MLVVLAYFVLLGLGLASVALLAFSGYRADRDFRQRIVQDIRNGQSRQLPQEVPMFPCPSCGAMVGQLIEKASVEP